MRTIALVSVLAVLVVVGALLLHEATKVVVAQETTLQHNIEVTLQ